jgi:hypothetical protein
MLDIDTFYSERVADSNDSVKCSVCKLEIAKVIIEAHGVYKRDGIDNTYFDLDIFYCTKCYENTRQISNKR